MVQLSYGRINTTGIKRSIGKFNKTYHERMKRLMRGGVRAFVKAAIAEIHVDTGMSGASLQPLAQAVGTGVLGSLGARSSRQGQTSLSGRYYRNRQRSISEGIKAGMNAYKLNYGTVARPMMFLRFETKVYQYALWEPTWATLEAGVTAMVDYIYENFDRYFPNAELQEIIFPQSEIGIK